ncbi:MAG TPA: sigma-70 family RNA polymerase sigma factor [Candidatus Ventricola intestinavium]|nr:sigma-70 family RNA polymerase sigma factor [Candidatus Ventricola intestinavium]
MERSMQGPAWTPEDGLNMETLVEQYGDELLRLCLLYMGDRHLAEDAFQETLVKAWRALPGFRRESSVYTWLSHIAVNVCRDMLRSGWFRLSRRSQPFDELTQVFAQDTGEASAVTQAVLALPGKYREVVVLYYYQDMKLREIADALHLPVNSVSTRLRRARMLLGRMLKGDVNP